MFDKIMRAFGFSPDDNMRDAVHRNAALSSDQRAAVQNAYEQADSLGWDEADRLAQQAQAAWNAGDKSKALMLYNKAITLRPGDSTFLLNRGNLHFDSGNLDAAMADFEMARISQPPLPDEVFIKWQMVQSLGKDSPVIEQMMAGRRGR